MLIALLTLLAALQTQPSNSVAPIPAPIQTAGVPAISPRPFSPPPPVEAAPAPPLPAEVAEPAEEAEPEPQTRQVCRYVEVSGQRFPVRTCRTVTVYPDDPT